MKYRAESYAPLIVTYIKANGRRSTAERAYLTADVLARPNLTVLTNAVVTRILFDSSNALRADGVEFKLSDGTKFECKALKEVVVW